MLDPGNANIDLERPFTPERQSSVLSDYELRALFEEGVQRVGTVSLVQNRDGKVLMLKHAQSDKSVGGAWGPIGETSLVQRTSTGWHIEPPYATLLRGLIEETGIHINAADVTRKTSEEFFYTLWPVGKDYQDQKAFAICPIVTVDDVTARRIEDMQPTNEVLEARFVELKDAFSLHPLRPGTQDWLLEAFAALSAGRLSDSSSLSIEPATMLDPELPAQDAILAHMFEGS